LLRRLLNYEGVETAVKAQVDEIAVTPVLPMHFRKDDVSLQLYRTIATLGTPQDVTLQELRIESFFPIDQATADVLRAWALKAKSTYNPPADQA
jgi:hypothetical protein